MCTLVRRLAGVLHLIERFEEAAHATRLRLRLRPSPGRSRHRRPRARSTRRVGGTPAAARDGAEALRGHGQLVPPLHLVEELRARVPSGRGRSSREHPSLATDGHGEIPVLQDIQHLDTDFVGWFPGRRGYRIRGRGGGGA